MCYSFSRRPKALMVAEAFTELEANDLGKHYTDLGFVKNPHPSEARLASYDVTLHKYIERYNVDSTEKVPYGLTSKKLERLNAIAQGVCMQLT